MAPGGARRTTMSRDPMRILLIGAGVRGRVWGKVCDEASDVSLCGVVDHMPERAEALVAVLSRSEASAGTDPDEAIRRLRPEAVIVATPPDGHAGLVLMAMARGCHVLCEKPLSNSLAQSEELVEAAHRLGRHLLVGMNFRYLPVSQRIRRAVRERELGEPSFAQFHYIRFRDGRREDLNDYPLSMPYPMLWEQSIHHFDLLRYCYGQEVHSLVADSFHPSWSRYDGDCCVSVLFRFESGLRVNYLGTWTASWNRMDFRWRSEFTDGVLLQRQQFDDLVRVAFRPELGAHGARFKGEADAEPAESEGLAACVPLVDDSRALLDEFSQAVRGGSEPVTTAADHLKSVRLVQACIDSIQARRWIDLAQAEGDSGSPAERAP